MAPQNIIQAFSRTNRIYDKSKRYGMIVIFQRSAEYKEAVDGALLLYSHGGTNEVSAPAFAELEKEFRKALNELKSLAPTPENVDALTDRSAMQKNQRFHGRMVCPEKRRTGYLGYFQERRQGFARHRL